MRATENPWRTELKIFRIWKVWPPSHPLPLASLCLVGAPAPAAFDFIKK